MNYLHGYDSMRINYAVHIIIDEVVERIVVGEAAGCVLMRLLDLCQGQELKMYGAFGLRNEVLLLWEPFHLFSRI